MKILMGLKNLSNHSLSVITIISTIACATFSTVTIPTATAATLNYNFQTKVEGINLGVDFSFDNSSLTGTGEESVQITNGTLQWLTPAVWRDPGSVNEYWVGALEGTWSLAGATAKILNGDFLGISASGTQTATTQTNGYSWFSTISWTIELKDFDSIWFYGWSWSGNGQQSFAAELAFAGPETVVPKVPEEEVPEPLTIFGSLAFGAFCLKKKRERKTA